MIYDPYIYLFLSLIWRPTPFSNYPKRQHRLHRSAYTLLTSSSLRLDKLQTPVFSAVSTCATIPGLFPMISRSSKSHHFTVMSFKTELSNRVKTAHNVLISQRQFTCQLERNCLFIVTFVSARGPVDCLLNLHRAWHRIFHCWEGCFKSARKSHVFLETFVTFSLSSRPLQ